MGKGGTGTENMKIGRGGTENINIRRGGTVNMNIWEEVALRI